MTNVAKGGSLATGRPKPGLPTQSVALGGTPKSGPVSGEVVVL